jgi:hypothetical protein
MKKQNELPRVAEFLSTVLPIFWKGTWLTVDEMTELTKLHPATIRWCIRQLQTGEEGEYVVRRRTRGMAVKIPEFYIKRKPAQLRFEYE